MDTPNTQPTNQGNAPSSTETPVPTDVLNPSAEGTEYDEGSSLQEFIGNIPWGKIILGIFILFVLVWGLIYIFSSKGETPTPAEVAVEEAKKTIASEQSMQVASLLGTANFNTLLQPHFSLEPSDITATEPKVALLQSLGVLEQTLDFDVWAHLEGQSDRAAALANYETKLNQSLAQSQQWLAALTAHKQDVNNAQVDTERQRTARLQDLNALLTSQPDSEEVVTRYSEFVDANYQLARLGSEIALINQALQQSTALVSKGATRKNNIELNRQAIVNNIKVVDLDDPGLELVIPARK